MKLKIEKNLCMFLESNNALEKFVQNLFNAPMIQLEKMIGWKVSHPINNIITQFVFSNTPEGFAYWNELNKLFEKQQEQQSVTDQFMLNKN